jgi:hypothetical protein
MRLPEFLNNQHIKMARLLALRIGLLYLTGKIEFYPVKVHEGTEGGLYLISALDYVDG